MIILLLGFFYYFVGSDASLGILQKLFRNIFPPLKVKSFLQKGKKKKQSVKNLAPSLQTNGDLAKCYTQIHVKCYTGFSPRAFMQTSFVILLI